MIVLTTGLSALLSLMGEHQNRGGVAGEPPTAARQGVRPAQSVRRPASRP